MKKLSLLLIAILCIVIANAQNAANYSFATNTTGSLSDMSTGTTQLLGANIDDTQAGPVSIGFDFFFQGIRYSQFAINENGVLRLGAAAQTGTPYQPLAQAALPIITAYGADQRTHAGDGKVHYKVTGSAPNRVLIVEWLNNQSNFNSGGTADLTYQVKLNETTGIIQFVYGNMTMSTLGAADVESNDPNIGFSSSNAAGTVGSVTAAQSGAPAPTYNGASATPVGNLYTAGAITTLSSAANGSRRVFTFTPPVPTAPSGLSFTAVAQTVTTLNWTDNSGNETGFAVYRSDDGGTTYNYISQTAANATSSAQAGLSPSINYFWRVYAVTEGALSSALQGSQSTTAALTITSISSGLWSQTTTWSSGTIPTAGENVVIANGHTVTIDIAAVALNLTVGQGASGVLQFEQTTARSLTVSSNVTITAGGTFQSNPAGTQIGHTLSLSGNLTNNGSLDFSTNADTGGAGITFTGASNSTFSGTGATNDIRTITINKGTSSANILEITTTNFTVRGTTTDGVVGGWLVMTNGTIKISGTFTGQSRVFAAAAYTIPATVGIWLNNPNYTIAAQAGNAVNNGLLRLTQGVFNQGTLASHSFRAGTGAIFTIEGGTLNCAGQFSPQNAVTYNQSAGVVNVGTVGNSQSNFGTFELFSATSTFTMSGGTINIVQASTGATQIDFQNLATSTITGGTLNVGTGATVTKFTFNVRGNLPGLTVDNTTNNKTATATAQVNLFAITQIKTGTTFTINGQVCLILGPTFTNNGTLTGTAAGTRFYFLGGVGATTYNGSGVVTAPLTAFEIDNVAGVTMDPAVNPVVTSRFNNFSGGLTNSNRLTVGNGGATTGVIQLGVAGATQVVNAFDVPPVFNPGTGGMILLYAPELTGRTTGNEMPPSRTLTTLSISNTNPITIAGGDVMVNGAGAGALALGVARVITGANTLYFNSAAGTVTRTTGYVDGNFKKSYVAAASKTFEVGTANGYSPVTINATAGTFPTDVTAKAVQGPQPNLNPATALQRYWPLTATGITADLTFNYLAADVSGTEANYKVVKVESGATTIFPASTVNTVTHVGTVTGITSFSDWTLAEPCTGATGGTASGSATFCGSGTATITATGYSADAGISYQWQSSNDNFVTNIVDIGGQTNPASLTTGVVSATTYYRLKVTCVTGPVTAFSNIITVTINTPASATIAYAGSPYCSNAGTATVTQTGTTGGTYTATPAGLSLNAVSGAVTLGTSTAGTYTVTYTVAAAGGCPVFTTTASITITAAPTATISYTGSPYCSNAGTATVTQTGTTGGAYTATPAGLSLNAVSGAVTLGTSTAGTYTVTYTIAAAGGCAVFTTTASITVTALPAATINYAGSPYCSNGGTATVTRTGTAGGTYSATPAGLTLNAANGDVTLGSSTAGTYTVTYTITAAGGCSVVTTTASITINTAPAATINYTGSPYCTSAGTATVTHTGTAGGTYSATPAGLSLNAANGDVTLGTSTAGTYTVTYTIAAGGGCAVVTTTASITVNALPVISSSQVEPTTCASSDGSINITISGTAPGPYTYAWTGPGVVNGQEDQTGLTVGSYSVTVTSTNGCSETISFVLLGPGGCSICPGITTFTTTPLGAACAGSNVTFTASALTNMGSTYGIIFKYAAAGLVNPYAGGTVIATVPNGSLTGGGTVATANSAVIPAGTYFVYAILTPTPVDPACRPAGITNLTIGTIPDVNQPANQVVCNTFPTAAVNFSGAVPGTIFSWTNNTTSIGLAASGTGNIASFTVTNATANPVVATVTVTPSYTSGAGSGSQTFNYTGSLQTYTIPAGVTSINITGRGAQGGSVSIGCAATGGLGARMQGDFAVTPGEVLSILVGQQGLTNGSDAGGGGGTFVVRTGNVALLVAGGGGGASNDINNCGGGANRNGVDATITQSGTSSGNGLVSGGTAGNGGGASNGSGGGGGGFLTDGTAGTGLAGNNGKSYLNGGAGGNGNNNDFGGYGGGGAGWFTGGNGGGGGGYSGGGTSGAQPFSGGGGGGSINTGGNQVNTAGVGTGDGQVIISYSSAQVTCTGSPKTFTITVNPTPAATIAYTGSPYCSNAGTATVTRTGTAGGTYSAAPAGLTINATTGDVTLATSTAGTYTVTYTIAAAGGCAAFSTTATITITALPAATISYAGSPYCQNAGTATVTRTGAAGGTYTATPAGLTLNATTGDVTLGTSTPGTYTVTYTLPAGGGCAVVTTTASITITALPAATIAYTGSPYCTSSGTATVTRTGTAGGTYSAAPAGLTLNAATGDVTLATSTAGTYTVTYTMAAGGGCPVVTATASITVTAANAATISYAGTPYCTTVSSAPVTRTGTAGGTYSAPAGLSINAGTGTVNPSLSTPGTYTVTYNMAATGGCPAATATTNITIVQAPNMIIFYAGTPYCSNGGTATVSQFGTTGGTYSAAPAGLTINATTGAVTLGTSTAGTYTVTYTVVVAGCGTTITTTTITITAAPAATIVYTGSPYCANAGTANVTRTGTAGGTYSSTAGLTINATTGAVTLATSTPGTYTVTYTVAAAGGCAVFTTTTTITITALPAATISYTGSPYCQNAGVANVTRTGTAGGTYSSTAGLSINATTGAVTLATSTAGTYTVTYTLAAGGGCPAVTATTTITITTLPAATISYAGSPYCANTGTATVTRTGTAGGTYSSTAGLVINATTGDVNLGTSTPGTYTVTYALAAGGGCPVVNATTTIVINSLSVAATGATASSTSLCGPGTVTLSVTGGTLGAGASWKWYSGTCGGTLVGTGASLTLTVNGTTTYFVRAEGTCNTTTCASVTVTVNTQPTISIAASPFTSLMPFQTTTLTATVNPANATNTMIWYRNGNVVPGATGLSLLVNVDGLGTYTARTTTTAGCTALSNAVLIKDSANDRVFITPNPNNGQFKVRYYSNSQVWGFQRHLVIFNEAGQKVYDYRFSITAPYSSMDVDIRKFARGFYTIMITDAFGNNVLATGKVVTQ